MQPPATVQAQDPIPGTESDGSRRMSLLLGAQTRVSRVRVGEEKSAQIV